MRRRRRPAVLAVAAAAVLSKRKPNNKRALEQQARKMTARRKLLHRRQRRRDLRRSWHSRQQRTRRRLHLHLHPWDVRNGVGDWRPHPPPTARTTGRIRRRASGLGRPWRSAVQPLPPPMAKTEGKTFRETIAAEPSAISPTAGTRRWRPRRPRTRRGGEVRRLDPRCSFPDELVLFLSYF